MVASTQADEIREYVLVAIIKPARRRGDKTVTFDALDVHKGMGFRVNRMPAVCEAVDTDLFLAGAGVTLVSRTGPAQSTTTRWTFAV